MRGWAIVVSVAVAGCGRVGFDEPLTCDDVTGPGVSTLVDNFSDGTLDPTWFSPDSCITETGGALVASPAANSNLSYCLAYTSSAYRVACDSLFVHVAQATALEHGSQTVLYLGDEKHSFFLLLDTGGFQLSQSEDKLNAVYVTEPYDPVKDAWWRIRGEPGVLRFDTSPDGTTWNDRAELEVPFSLDALQVTLGAGTYAPVANPGVARFRCFNEPPPCL